MRIEEILDREIREREGYLTGHTRLTPTERELHLIVGFGLQIHDDIDSAVVLVRLRADVHILRVEVSGGGDFAH